MFKRLLIAAALLLTIHIGVQLLLAGISPGRVAMPDPVLSELPLQLGDWRGEDYELEPEMYPAIEAAYVVTRVYTHTDGRSVSLFLAVYDDQFEALEHYPPVCYAASGYEVGPLEYVKVPTEALGNVPAQMMDARLDGYRSKCLFWYQIGSDTITRSRKSLVGVKRKYWGADAWPALVKVQLATSTGDEQQAEEALQEFSRLIADEINRSVLEDAER